MARSARSKGLKDPAFLNFIRRQACFLCDDMIDRRVFGNGIPHQQRSRTEAAHVGERGLSQKSSDREVIPLCAQHHRTGKDSHHVMGKRFWTFHGIDKQAIVAAYNKWFEREKAA